MSLLVLVTLLLAAGALLKHRERALDALSEAGHWMAGLGDMEWWDGEAWVPVGPADARRRQWGPTDTFLTPEYRTIATGLELAELSVRRAPNPQEVVLGIARADPRRWSVQVRMAETPQPVEWFGAKHGFTLAVNASFFSEEGPLGLVVGDGRRESRPVSHRAAHFLVDGPGRLPRIVNQKRASVAGVREGFQGFPSIMSDGVTFGYMRAGGRGFDVWTVDRRTAACVTRDRQLLFLVTDTLTNGLTFDELATVLGGLGCVDAMGFDGGTSTGMYVKGRRGVPGLRPVLVVVGLAPLP